jgi:hypothetical protein
MKKITIKHCVGLVAVFLTLCFQVANAQSIPQKISFQGKLLESGSAVNGTRDLTFSFVGTAWTELHAAVPITNGLYSVTLGESTLIPVSVFNNSSIATLHILVGGVPLSPDLSITSSGFAFKAEKSDDTKKIAGYTVNPVAPTLNYYLKYDGTQWSPSSGDWLLNSNNLSNTNTGAVLINSFTPSGKLTVSDTGTAIYGGSNALTKGRHGVYGYQGSSSDATSSAITEAMAGTVGFAYWGKPYHYGVAGYRYDDSYGQSAGVFGAISFSPSPTAWGALGYQEEVTLAEYGGYFHGNIFTDGQIKIAGGSPGAGKLLTSDANGLASWSSPGTYSQWITNGTNLAYTTGNVGIGINPPTRPLHVTSAQITTATSVILGENTYSGTNNWVYGIEGRVNSSSPNTGPGVGVMGLSLNTTGGGAGVMGQSNGLTGIGVRAIANSATGANMALYAATTSPDGFAGYFYGAKNYFQGSVGIGTTTPGSLLTVTGSQANTAGSIAYVENTYSGSNAWVYGIQGRVNSTSANTGPGIGVLGISNSSTGGGAGVMGQSNGVTGIGVRAIANSASGANMALYAATTSPDGFAGYFYGAKNYFQGSIGIGTTAPDEELVVGSPMGMGWALPAVTISDASGGAIDIGTPTEHISIDHGSIYHRARIRSSDASGTGLGNIEFIVDKIGIGQSVPIAKLHVENTGSVKTGYFKGTGAGLNYVTLMSENTGAAGIGAYFKTYGTDATLVLGQDAAATGALLKGFGANGGDDEIRINNDGEILIFNSAHIQTVSINPSETGTADGSQITLYNAAGTAVIEMDANYGGTTKGRVTTSELEITGGADIAEPFIVSDNDKLRPGMVLSIDSKNPGQLKISDKAYDRCVAGIVSGASDIQPGLILRQKGTITDGQHLVALTGRVYCLVDATKNPVEPGDMLTSSSTAGYAMKVENNSKATGAIIGKAMTALESGMGLVLVLVSLQ